MSKKQMQALDAPTTDTQALEEAATVSTDYFGRDESYVRNDALGYAITFHRNNGGMMTPAQLVEHANTFLAFLKGENK